MGRIRQALHRAFREHHSTTAVMLPNGIIREIDETHDSKLNSYHHRGSGFYPTGVTLSGNVTGSRVDAIRDYFPVPACPPPVFVNMAPPPVLTVRPRVVVLSPVETVTHVKTTVHYGTWRPVGAGTCVDQPIGEPGIEQYPTTAYTTTKP